MKNIITLSFFATFALLMLCISPKLEAKHHYHHHHLPHHQLAVDAGYCLLPLFFGFVRVWRAPGRTERALPHGRARFGVDAALVPDSSRRTVHASEVRGSRDDFVRDGAYRDGRTVAI